MRKATEEIADGPTSNSRDYRTTAICYTASAQAKIRSRFPMSLLQCQMPQRYGPTTARSPTIRTFPQLRRRPTKDGRRRYRHQPAQGL